MTTPAGFLVVTSTKQRMLILTQAAAVDKAALHHGTVDKLFTIKQIMAALEASPHDIQGLGDVEIVLSGLGELA